jgi:hypothetical protein
MTLTSLQEQAWILIQHSRKGSEITGKSIANAIGLKPRSSGKDGADMRSIIHALRVKGYPICANGKGYYTANGILEVDEYADSLEARINDMETALDGIRHARPLSELLIEDEITSI